MMDSPAYNCYTSSSQGMSNNLKVDMSDYADFNNVSGIPPQGMPNNINTDASDVYAAIGNSNETEEHHTVI